MSIIGHPRICSFGCSYGKFGGELLEDYEVSSLIDTSKLNKNVAQDTVELNRFETEIKDYVMGYLGHPIIRVELTPFQIKLAIDEAISKLSYHCPLYNRQIAVFEASATISLYRLPSFICENLTNVVFRKSLLSIQAQAGTLEYDFFIKYFQDNFLFADFSVSEFYILQMYMETMRKVLSQEGSWELLNGSVLNINPTPVVTPEYVILEFRALDSSTMHPTYKNWIQKYALALCKIILGGIRGKFKRVPSPGGGAELDGAELKDEGKEEKSTLEQELINEIEDPIPFTAY